MKRFTRAFLIFLAALVLVVLIFPTFFKDRIKRAILDAFAQNVNAELFFSDVNLSLIPNFPDFTLSISDVGIVGVGIFEGDTLVQAQDASITFNVMDAISGEEIGAQSIALTEPSILILTLVDGTANYDIARESEQKPVESTAEAGEVSFAINRFTITDGEFIYFDQSSEVFMQLEEIDVTGDGNFENDIFDLVTTGSLNLYDFNYAGVDYVEDKLVELDVTLGMDLKNSTYTFKENQILVNTFPLHADGSFSLLENGYGMELTFDAPEATFAQFLSLIPGIYQSTVSDLEADGNLNFEGAVNGIYSEESMPAFDFALTVSNGVFAYDSYPEKVEDFNLDLKLQNKSGEVEDTGIEVNPLTLRVGNSPFEARLEIANLKDYEWNLVANGDLDLALVNSLFPQEGVALGGIIRTNLESRGNYKLVEKEAYDQLPFAGELKLESFNYQDSDLIDVAIKRANLVFDNNRVSLSGLSGSTKSTSFQAKGEISNFLGFALADEVLMGEFVGSADRLNVNEWMVAGVEDVEVTEETSDYEVMRIPENIDFKASMEIQEVSYNDLNFKNAKGRLNISEGIISFDDSGMDLLNGTLGIKGSYNSLVEKPIFDFGLNLANISIPQSFQSISMVKSFAPITQNMTGLFSSNFRVTGELGDGLMPDISTLSASGLIEVLQASLGNSDVLTGLSSVTKLADVAGATLEKVKMQAEIKNGRLFVKPFKVKIGQYNSEVFGSSGIDGSVDYSIAMNIPSGKVGGQLNALVSDLVGSKQNLVGQNLTMTIRMTGDFTKPKFAIKSVTSEKGETYKEQVTNTIKAEVKAKSDSVKQVAEEKVQTVKDSANTLVKAKKDSLSVLADSLVNAKKDTLSSLAAKKLGLEKDSVDAELKNVKDKAKDALKGLFKNKKKKKNN